MANLSQRECEKTHFAHSPEALSRESDRIVSAAEEQKLEVVISPQLHEKLQQLKGLLAHKLPKCCKTEPLEYLATEALARVEK